MDTKGSEMKNKFHEAFWKMRRKASLILKTNI